MRLAKVKKDVLTLNESECKAVKEKSNGSVVRESRRRLSNGARRLKVYYKLGGFKKVPVILLQGEWIRKLGFNVEDIIMVSEENGELRIKRVN